MRIYSYYSSVKMDIHCIYTSLQLYMKKWQDFSRSLFLSSYQIIGLQIVGLFPVPKQLVDKGYEQRKKKEIETEGKRKRKRKKEREKEREKERKRQTVRKQNIPWFKY